MRIVFLGTPAFAVPSLEALYHSDHEIAAVYSQPPRPAGRGQKETPSPIHTLALAHNTPVYTPISLKDPKIQAEFASHKADIAIVAAYGLLLPPAILKTYPHGCINVHPSLLPRWRGAAPIQRTVMASDNTTGICIMQMDAGLDTGDILLIEKYTVTDDMNSGALHDALAGAAGPLLLRTLEAFQNNNVTRQKQSADGITYAKKITKEECRIDWNESATVIYNKIRGLSPYPCAFFMYKGEAIKILKADVYKNSGFIADCKPGKMIDNKQRMIACGEDLLMPEYVQRPGKKSMPWDEMLRGHPIAANEILE